LSLPLGMVLQGLTKGFLALGLALWYSWKLTLVIVSIVPIAAVALHVITRGLQQHIKLQTECLEEASKIASNALANIAVVKCFNASSQETLRYMAAIRNAAPHSRRQSRVQALQTSVAIISMFAMFMMGTLISQRVQVLADTRQGSGMGEFLFTLWRRHQQKS
jgi:ATP-binding cassette, subfamily B (MDR/TAP), member 1